MSSINTTSQSKPMDLSSPPSKTVHAPSYLYKYYVRRNFSYMGLVTLVLFMAQILPFLLLQGDKVNVSTIVGLFSPLFTQEAGSLYRSANLLLTMQIALLVPIMAILAWYPVYTCFGENFKKNASDWIYALPLTRNHQTTIRLGALLTVELLPFLVHALALLAFFGLSTHTLPEHLESMFGTVTGASREVFSPWLAYAPFYLNFVAGVLAYILVLTFWVGMTGKGSEFMVVGWALQVFWGLLLIAPNVFRLLAHKDIIDWLNLWEGTWGQCLILSNQSSYPGHLLHLMRAGSVSLNFALPMGPENIPLAITGNLVLLALVFLVFRYRPAEIADQPMFDFAWYKVFMTLAAMTGGFSVGCFFHLVFFDRSRMDFWIGAMLGAILSIALACFIGKGATWPKFRKSLIYGALGYLLLVVYALIWIKAIA